jgi:hypothetical protein
MHYEIDATVARHVILKVTYGIRQPTDSRHLKRDIDATCGSGQTFASGSSGHVAVNVDINCTLEYGREYEMIAELWTATESQELGKVLTSASFGDLHLQSTTTPVPTFPPKMMVFEMAVPALMSFERRQHLEATILGELTSESNNLDIESSDIVDLQFVLADDGLSITVEITLTSTSAAKANSVADQIQSCSFCVVFEGELSCPNHVSSAGCAASDTVCGSPLAVCGDDTVCRPLASIPSLYECMCETEDGVFVSCPTASTSSNSSSAGISSMALIIMIIVILVLICVCIECALFKYRKKNKMNEGEVHEPKRLAKRSPTGSNFTMEWEDDDPPAFSMPWKPTEAPDQRPASQHAPTQQPRQGDLGGLHHPSPRGSRHVGFTDPFSPVSAMSWGSSAHAPSVQTDRDDDNIYDYAHVNDEENPTAAAVYRLIRSQSVKESDDNAEHQSGTFHPSLGRHVAGRDSLAAADAQAMTLRAHPRVGHSPTESLPTRYDFDGIIPPQQIDCNSDNRMSRMQTMDLTGKGTVRQPSAARSSMQTAGWSFYQGSDTNSQNETPFINRENWESDTHGIDAVPSSFEEIYDSMGGMKFIEDTGGSTVDGTTLDMGGGHSTVDDRAKGGKKKGNALRLGNRLSMYNFPKIHNPVVDEGDPFDHEPVYDLASVETALSPVEYDASPAFLSALADGEFSQLASGNFYRETDQSMGVHSVSDHDRSATAGNCVEVDDSVAADQPSQFHGSPAHDLFSKKNTFASATTLRSLSTAEESILDDQEAEPVQLQTFSSRVGSDRRQESNASA